MSKMDRVDSLIGNGSTHITAGAYKDDKGETRYKFGFALDIPTKANLGEELTEKIYNLGLHRVMSVKAAGIFNEKNEYGSAEDAQAFHTMFSTVDGWKEAFEKARREAGEKEESRESQYIRELASVLRDKSKAGYDFATAKVEVPRHADPPKTEKGHINFVAWAKIVRDGKHPWYDLAVKTVDKKADKYA